MYVQQIQYNLTLKEPGHMRASENLGRASRIYTLYNTGPEGQ